MAPMLQFVPFAFEHWPLRALAHVSAGKNGGRTAVPPESLSDVLARLAQVRSGRQSFQGHHQQVGHQDMSALAFLDGQCLLLCHNAPLHRS